MFCNRHERYRPLYGRGDARGISLAEVVVAVLIFGMAAAVLGQAVTDSLRSYGLSRQSKSYAFPEGNVRRHVLGILSRSQLEEGGEMEIPIAVRSAEGDQVQTEMVRVRWEAEILPTRILDVYVIELTIRQESGDNQDEVTRNYIAYRPTWGDQTEVDQLMTAKEKEFEDRLGARGVIDEEDAT